MSAKNSPKQESIGNYDLLEKIGDGSMGTVYKARHWQTRAIVAVKVIHPHIARNAVLVKRFEQEYRVTSKLDHPNVVRVLEYSNADGRPFLVMELVEGLSLGEKLDREGKMTEEEAIRIIVQVSHGLHRAHRQGLIHRDVKPDNIVVTHDGRAKLTDLGLAKDMDANAELTKTGRGLGTPDFMAPEQFRNAKNASIRCDVYSLAATLYQMVTGQLPFDEEEPVRAMTRKLKNDFLAPSAIVPDLSERTDWAIRRAMSADPDQRPGSCREFAEDLLGQSTRGSKSDVDAGDLDVWFMVFTDPDGMVRTAKGSTKAIQRTLKDGDMGEPSTVRASRSPTGPFELLQFFPEFRELVVAPAPGPPLSEMSIANLQRLRRSPEAAKYLEPRDPSPAPPPPAATERKPHFRLGSVTDMGGGTIPMWKVLILMVLTVLTTLLAAKYLLLGGK